MTSAKRESVFPRGMRWSCKSPVHSTTSSGARAQTFLAHSRKTESKVVSCCVACGSLASVRACPCQSTRRCILWGRVGCVLKRLWRHRSGIRLWGGTPVFSGLWAACSEHCKAALVQLFLQKSRCCLVLREGHGTSCVTVGNSPDSLRASVVTPR